MSSDDIHAFPFHGGSCGDDGGDEDKTDGGENFNFSLLGLVMLEQDDCWCACGVMSVVIRP